jgi:hypothetical protein
MHPVNGASSEKMLLPMVPVETEGCLGLFTSSEAVLFSYYDYGGLVGFDPLLESGGLTTLGCGGAGGAE